MGLSQTAWVLIAFILFFVLVGKKLWSALTTNLDQRKKMIENELNEAKKLREEAQAELNASLKKQKEINKQVLDIINDAKSTDKKINKKPRETPIAKLLPVPPLLLKEDTESAIRVRIKHDKGIVYLLCLTSKWELISGDPALFSYLIRLFNSKKFRVSAT